MGACRSAKCFRRAAGPVAPLLLVLLVTGCTTYSSKIADLRPELANGEFAAALETIEKETGSKDVMLYFMERGIVLHYADRWRESNEAFAAAERLSDELYSKSMTEGALSLISNDNAISYRARPFELAMMPYFKAMNYSYLGEREEAQVEARRASLQMSKYVDVTLQGVRKEDRGELERIRNNPFLLYTSGMIYDWDGELNDAFTAYRNAAVAYQQSAGLLRVEPPPSLARDLVRVSRRLGFWTELEQVRQSCPDVFGDLEVDVDSLRTRESYGRDYGWQPGHGEVVLFLESGWVSHKSQIRFDVPIFEGEAYDDPDYWAWEMYGGMGNTQALVKGRKVEYWASVAAPEMQDAPGPLGQVVARSMPSGASADGYRVENLSRHARITFDAEKPTIFFKTILRALTKYLASRGAKEAGGDWAKWAVNIFGAVTESADTRSWFTLPAEVHLVRLSLPAGLHDITVELTDRNGGARASYEVRRVEVRAGDWTFVSRRLF